MNRKLYPANWDAIALEVKTAANWRCKWCDKPCRMPGEKWAETVARIMVEGNLTWYLQTRDEVTNGMGETRFVERPQRFTLTTAHYPDHNPANCDRENLVALCSTCHARLDLSPSSMAQKRQLKREREGQLNLLNSPPVQPTATPPPTPKPHPVAVPVKPKSDPLPQPPSPSPIADPGAHR